MALQVNRETDVLIQRIVEAGRYHDADEVIREAVRQLDERDRRLAELRAALAVGEEQIARGEVVEWTPQLAAEIWEATKRDARAGKKPKPDVLPLATGHPHKRSTGRLRSIDIDGISNSIFDRPVSCHLTLPDPYVSGKRG